MRGAYLMSTPRTWRVLGDDSQPEAYIPLGPHPRSRNILDAVAVWPIPTAEDRARRAAESQQQAQADAVQLDAHIARHPLLVEAHKANPILTVFLTEHSPHRESPTSAECHGCEEHYDDWGSYYDVWPCVPWRTIDENTPRSV